MRTAKGKVLINFAPKTGQTCPTLTQLTYSDAGPLVIKN